MKNFYNNFTVLSIFNMQMLKSLTAYLAKTSDNILPQNQQEIIFKEKTIANDLISKVYREIEKTGITTPMFSLLYPPRKVPLPEIVTYSSLLMDFEQLHEFNPSLTTLIQSYPEYDRKNVINITPYVKPNLLFSDQSEFQQRVIRDVLSKSFFLEKKCWVKPVLKIIGKIYSIALSKPLAGVYNLSVGEYLILNSLFLYYFFTITSSQEYAKGLMSSYTNYFGSVDKQNLNAFFSQVEDILKGNPLTKLMQIFQCSKELLPERTKSMGYQTLAKLTTKLGTDSISSTIALEYPPYFVYLVIAALSRIKTGLAYRIKEYLSPKDVNDLDQYFSSNPSFLSVVKQNESKMY